MKDTICSRISEDFSIILGLAINSLYLRVFVSKLASAINKMADWALDFETINSNYFRQWNPSNLILRPEIKK